MNLVNDNVWMTVSGKDALTEETPAVEVNLRRYGITEAGEQLRKMAEILSPVMGEGEVTPEAITLADQAYREFILGQVLGVREAGKDSLMTSEELHLLASSMYDSRVWNAALQEVVIKVLREG